MRALPCRALILALIVLWVFFICAGYIALKAAHDCTGGDCPVCAHIHHCIDALHRMGNGLALLLSGVVISGILLGYGIRQCGFRLSHSTPVSLKVRQNS